MADQSPDASLVVVRRYTHLYEAELAKSALESAGIESFLEDDVTIGMNWAWSNALGGVKVCVRREDEAAATQVLASATPDDFEVEGVGKYEQPRCPKCGSSAISSSGLNSGRAALLGGYYVGLPILYKRDVAWKCDSCGHEWPPS